MVHRGDGVFEVIKYRHGYIYQFQAHLDRLKTSAEAVEIKPPVDYGEIKKIVKDTVRLTKTKDGIIHIYISRGPGGFSVNPFESEQSQLYVVITRWKEVPTRYYREGVKVIVSDIPVKPGFFAQIKSCNYLPNVLMKQQAIKARADFAVNLDEKGNLAEGATESIGLVTKEGFLKFPEFKRILRGITLGRVAILAKELEKRRLIKGIKFGDISLEEVYAAQEVFLFGTTIDVLPVTIFAGKKIGSGRPGPVFFALKELFETDIFSLDISEPI
jgi:branched-chain amino acid aminotransferase